VEDLNAPTYADPFQLGISAASLKDIYSLQVSRLEDIVRPQYITRHTNSSTSTLQTTHGPKTDKGDS